MKKFFTIIILLLFSTSSFSSSHHSHGHKKNKEMDHDYKIGKIEIEKPYTFFTPNGAKVSAGYMKIENESNKQDVLQSVSNVSFADKVEIHEMTMENQVMKMRPLKKGLVIKADSEVYLKPSGYHIMFIGLKEQISKGKEYKATLNFKNAGSVDIFFKAVGRNYHPDKNHHKHH